MKSKKIILSIIALIILAIILVCSLYYFKQKNTTPAEIKPISNTVTYFCQEGTLKATYEKSDVILSFKNGSTTTLPQTISGSGIRYELGSTTLVSEGNNANLTENNKETYTKCVAGNQTSNEGVNTYTDNSKTFSFSYPGQFILSGGDIGYSQDWSYGTDKLGLLLAVVNIPKSFMPKTNFGESRFTVGTSVDPDAVKNCLTYNYGGMGSTSMVTIGDRKFTKMKFSDAGAGNYYDTTSYRTIYNGQCFAIEYTVHSTNIYNYSPDQGIKAFDEAKITHILDGIVYSFKFE